MKINHFAFFVFVAVLFASCGGSKENKTDELQVEATDSIVEEVPEEPSFLVKSLEINQDGAVDSKVTFEYDEVGQLIKTTTHRNIGTEDEWTIESTISYRDGTITCDCGMKKLELTLDADSCVKKEEFITDGESFVKRYKYKSGKVCECINEMDCGNTYIWDGGNVCINKVFAPSCDESFSFDSIDYKYGDVDRPNVDVIAFAQESGYLPQALTVAPKGLVSRYMPTEIKYRVYNDGADLMATTVIKYTYTTDEYNRLSTFEYNIKVYYDGEEEDQGNVSVKVNY